MVSFRAFWVISYRLAACFTRIWNTRGAEIYWRSFQQKMTKMRQKLLKIARKLFFCTFSVFILLIFWVWWIGGIPSCSPSPWLRPWSWLWRWTKLGPNRAQAYRSSVNFRGARHFCPKNMYEKINKMSEFYMIFARKVPEFYIIIARKIFSPIFCETPMTIALSACDASSRNTVHIQIALSHALDALATACHRLNG